MSERLRVVALYPELMNIYADRGNLLMLERRCRWRDIGFELKAVSFDDRLAPGECDLIYIGGGQDRDQALCARDLVQRKRDALLEAVAGGCALLAVCGGYQLLGRSYRLGDETLPGLGLVGADTVREPGPRLIGNCVIETTLGGELRLLAGFENHGGRTYLDPGVEPLGRVVRGHGNNGRDGGEGVVQGNVIGTYLHGPLLPKNAWLADFLIERALGIALAPLEDGLEQAAHECAIEAAGLPLARLDRAAYADLR